MFFQKILSGFCISACFLIVFIITKGDDAGKFPPIRTPTPNEALVRIGYIFAKLVTILYSASIMVYFLFAFHLLQNLTNNAISSTFVMCAFTASLLIRFLQNLIRKMQKRPPAPYLDISTLRHNLGQRNNSGRRLW